MRSLPPLLACLALAGGGCSPPPQVADAIKSREFRLIWADEFDGEAGQPPAVDRWVHDVGGDGWGNSQLEFDTDRTENVALDGAGNLAITARDEPFQHRGYTSGRIATRALFERAYGRFEASIRQPRGRGLWSAFWLLGADHGDVGWPASGEIDVMEYRGQDRRTVLGTLHGPGFSGGAGVGADVVADEGLDEGFHRYAIEWDPGRIVWYLDGRLYHIVTPELLGEHGVWVFDHPFYMILNLAVGGAFVGAPDAETEFPQTLLVDYVRVYERIL